MTADGPAACSGRRVLCEADVVRHNRGRGAAIADGLLTPRAVLVGFVAIVVLLGVALAAREAGPIPIDERALFGGVDDTTALTAPAQAEEQTERPSDESEDLLSKVSMWYVIVSWVVLALLLVLVVRALISIRKDRADDGEKSPAPPPDGVPWADPTHHLQRAAARAEEVLLAARPGTTKDAVIAAWMQLEQAATAAGSGRPASATPTEFTVVLLQRYAVDADAMTALLSLYHRARFGGQALPPAAVDEALAAVRTIATGLGAMRTGAS